MVILSTCPFKAMPSYNYILTTYVCMHHRKKINVENDKNNIQSCFSVILIVSTYIKLISKSTDVEDTLQLTCQRVYWYLKTNWINCLLTA